MSAAPLRYEVLGPLRVLRGDQEVPIAAPKRRQLLAVLLCAQGRNVSIDRAIDQLWPNGPPASARNIVQQHIHHLRHELGDDLRTESAGYTLDTRRDVDAVRFEEAIASAGDADDPERADTLSNALDLWKGEAFGEFSEMEWPSSEALRLAELRTGAIEDLSEVLLLSNQSVAAIALLTPHLREHDLSDRPHGLMMRALAVQGRQTEALRLFQKYRSHLGESVGVEPAAELRDLERRIAAGWRDNVDTRSGRLDRPTDSSPVPGDNVVEHNLSRDLDALIDRPAVREVGELAVAHRLVSIVGPGGIGKSRCASAVGRTLVSMSADSAPFEGVWFVELSTAVDSNDAWLATMEALRLRKVDVSPRDTVLDYLRHRRVLLILDNCEHVVDWVRDFLGTLLDEGRSANIVATSRIDLQAPGERAFPLGPMSEIEAELLFEKRLDENGLGPFARQDIADLCALLDHYPLALELAAARCRILSPREIFERLGKTKGLLTIERRTPERHRSLDAALSWSLAQLKPDALAVLQQATIFRRDFDFSAAEAVLDAGTTTNVVEHLASLVDQHLIRRDHRRERFRILEPVRQALLAGTPHSDGLCERHGRHYMALLAEISEGLLGAHEATWWDRLQSELTNIRDALAWAISAMEAELIEAAMRWFPPTVHFLLFTEAADWAVDALDGLGLDPTEVPATSLTAATGWHRVGDFERSERLMTRLENELDESAEAMFCFVRSTQYFMAGEPQQAIEWGGQCVATATDQTVRALGWIAQMSPDAVTAADSLGTPTLRAYSRFFQYGLMDEASKLTALRFVEDSYYASLASHNPFCIACGETVLASVLLRLGDIRQGAALMFSGAESMLRYRSHFLVRHVVETAANGLAGGGNYVPAVVLWSAIDKTGRGGLARNLRNPALPDRAVAELSAAELQDAQRFGETLTIDHAAEFALETLEKLATE